MSTSCCTEICPKCGKEALFVDFDCRTGEYDEFCEFCGFGQHFAWVRDENFDIVRKTNKYPLTEVFLVVRDFKTDEFYMKRPVSEIEGFNTNMIDYYLNHADGYRFDEFENGINNFYWISGEKVERLFATGNELEVDGENMVVHKVEIEFEEWGGYGHILAFYDTCSKEIKFDKDTSKEQAIKMVEEVKNSDGVKEILAVWYNSETETYELIYGEYRENEPYSETNTSYTEDSSDGGLPF